ncbi:TPA: hypothetical protein OW396_003662 [Pseudomonas aeruginosa]|nr:hypothetical protein [Pseudomonas aeruginosa]HCW0824737.1 hypothetical protein [Pseudomonas aeruginosa]HCW0855156.1 hypothetical protein [Pseudomonas aeruginosa]
MKRMYFGLFLAVSALPMALIAGVLTYQARFASLPGALEAAAITASVALGVGFFVFMAGIAPSERVGARSVDGNGWSDDAR